MKNFIYILFSLFVVVISSCAKIDEGETVYKTRQGYVAFNTTLIYTNQVMKLTELIAKTNLYIETPESEKENVAQLYLPNCEIEKDPFSNTVILIEGRIKYILIYDGLLGTANSIWNIKEILYLDEGKWITLTSDDFSFSIKNQDGPNWIISFNDLSSRVYTYMDLTTDYQSGVLNVTPSIADTSDEGVLNNYSIEGTSKIISDMTLDVTYISPTKYRGQYADVATIELNVIKADKTQDKVKGYYNGSTVEITFKGITETYMGGGYY